MTNGKPKGILFGAPMIRALLNTKPDVWPAEAIDPSQPWKWQTRRLVTPQPPETAANPHVVAFCYRWWLPQRFSWPGPSKAKATGGISVPHPVGSVIYAKERYSISGNGAYYPNQCDGTVKHAWLNAMFMPKKFARLWFEVMAVRVERVKEISGEDAESEGVDFCNTLFPTVNRADKAQALYRTLWESINGKGSWSKNPWVWVYHLKRIEKP